MWKQCVNCKRANRPTTHSACNQKVKLPLVDIVEFKYHADGSSYCDDFKSVYRGGDDKTKR